MPSRPAPSITWKKNGQLIVDKQDSFVIPTSFHERRLDIKNVTRAKHEDQYTCEAVNALSNGNPLIHTINLEVEGKYSSFKNVFKLLNLLNRLRG